MALDTIKILLAKSGVSDEVATQIVESMKEYKATILSESQKDLSAKLKTAKAVIFEEVATYKTDLARQVQLFCESKSQTIEQQLMRKSAAGETEAKTKLNQVYSLLEGIDLTAKPNGQQAAKNADAANQIGRLNKQLKAVKAQAERSARIAENVMEKNQKLIKENKSLQDGQVIQEGKGRQAKSAPSIIVPARQRAVTAAPAAAGNDVITESTITTVKATTVNVNSIDDIAANMM